MIYKAADYAQNRQFHAEVVVIGTGAGGAAAGTALAEAGRDVLFVEEGAWHPTSSLNPYARQSMPRLYRDAGTTIIFGRPPFPYLEGRCVGGSTVVNGGMAWRAPDSVLAGWESELSASELSPSAMAHLFETVERDVSIKPQHPASIGGDNRTMHLGAAKLGWEHRKNRRNQHHCTGSNNCIFGCPTGGKQSTLVSYMPRAMAAGARCLTELRIESLLIEDGRCVGVLGRARDARTQRLTHRVTVRANAVVVACGAVQTPLLLLKHRVGRPSGQLGRNFLTHPNVKVLAIYPHDIRGWQGVSQWGQVRQFHEEGIVLAANMGSAALVAATLPHHGRSLWQLMQRYNNMVLSGVLVEDSNSGRVRRGPFGMALPFYNITEHDHVRFLKAVRLLCELHLSMGAEELHLPFANMLIATTMDEVRTIQADRIRPEHLELFTPHLMGTARMGTDARHSVIDLNGQVWDLPGLFVADASVFPTAIGVNPQVTIMALATRIGRRLADRLARTDQALRIGRQRTAAGGGRQGRGHAHRPDSQAQRHPVRV